MLRQNGGLKQGLLLRLIYQNIVAVIVVITYHDRWKKTKYVQAVKVIVFVKWKQRCSLTSLKCVLEFLKVEDAKLPIIYCSSDCWQRPS